MLVATMVYALCWLTADGIKAGMSSLLYLLVEGLGLVGQAAVGCAVLKAQLVGVAAQHPRQHRRHREIHRHLAAHLPCRKATPLS